MHSTTKYLGGHSDMTGGALVAPTENEWTTRLRTLQALGGAVPSPFDCWLAHARHPDAAVADAGARGERGLGGRLPGGARAVEAVHYPGCRPIRATRWPRSR